MSIRLSLYLDSPFIPFGGKAYITYWNSQAYSKTYSWITENYPLAFPEHYGFDYFGNSQEDIKKPSTGAGRCPVQFLQKGSKNFGWGS